MRKTTGLSFYKSSQYDFDRLLKDPNQLRENLVEYVTSSASSIDVFEQFGFEQVVKTLGESNRLYLVVEKFGGVILHPKTVSNAEMGDLLEHLIYKFAEASNEEAGKYDTPRDAIRLMIGLLLTEERESLLGECVVRTVFDPAFMRNSCVSRETCSAVHPDVWRSVWSLVRRRPILHGGDCGSKMARIGSLSV